MTPIALTPTTRTTSGFSWRRVRGVMRKNLYVMRHSPLRVMELVYWPIIEVVLWGFITDYLRGKSSVPGGVGVLLGAVVLWDVLFRTQQELAMLYLTDMWDRSIINTYTSPLRVSEHVVADIAFSIARVGVGSTLLLVFTRVAFGFDVLDTGRVLVPSVIVLLGFGWSLGLAIRAAVMRFGSNAEVLAWSLSVLVQPIAAVFYPISNLPGWLQPVARAIPASHVFEALRAFLAHGDFQAGQLVVGALLDVVYVAAGAWLVARAYRSVREKGLLSRPGY